MKYLLHEKLIATTCLITTLLAGTPQAVHAMMDDVIEDREDAQEERHLPAGAATPCRKHPASAQEETKADLIMDFSQFHQEVVKAMRVEAARMELEGLLQE